jgi:hypothetical protein
MSLTIPSGLRYRVVNLLEGKPSPVSAGLLRGSILLSLILMTVPWKVAKEVAYGSSRVSPDLKSALRTMLWIWNRSWIPFRFRLGTYFDIGWHLSTESCQALVQKGFISRKQLKRQCDLAQLKLSAIRDCVQTKDHGCLLTADQEIRSLVNSVLSEAYRWAMSTDCVETDKGSIKTEANSSKRVADNRFDNERTRSALLDFDDLCSVVGLRYFLVSGTFLGVVRDRAFIGHDHDIDVGVFEDDLTESLIPALSESENFIVNQVDYICLRQVDGDDVQYALMEKPAIIRLAHKTGISIDIFTHFDDGDLVWHGSSVHRWDNTKFDLGEYEFLGRSFKGALDFDRYLNENYGSDWRVPKVDFNVNLDTPNLSFVGTANALVFFSWVITNAVDEKKPDRVKKYTEMLSALGAIEIQEGIISVI